MREEKGWQMFVLQNIPRGSCTPPAKAGACFEMVS